MSDIIYYVASRLSEESVLGLAAHFGLPSLKLHSTLAFSRSWFTYRDDQQYPIVVDPPFEVSKHGTQHVLLIRSPELALRHIELRAAGATVDYPIFSLHITLGKQIRTQRVPEFPLVFDKEYYGTWRE
jgi:hypothetical protein